MVPEVPMRPLHFAARVPWLVFLVAVLAFLPSLYNGFVYDDESYILKNPLIASWSLEHLWSMLTRPYFGNFHPLHMLAMAVEHAAFGLSPMGWHAVSLVLHGLNALLLCRLLPRFGVSRRIALAGALLFAVHPVQAESVAWVSEQKSLLSLLFTLLALGKYLDARASGARRDLALAAFSFLLALAAKVQAVALAPVLVAIEWLRPPMLPSAGGRSLLRVLPFLLLAGGSANLEILAHGNSGFIHAWPGGSLGTAVLSIGPVLALYAKNLLWPMGLSASYDLPPATGLSPWMLGAAWIAVTALFVRAVSRAFREPKRRLALAIVWVIASLLPVLNLIPIGTLLNDRYLYVPLCALGPMAAWGLMCLGPLAVRKTGRAAGVRVALRAAVAALVILLAAGSAARSGVWRNEESLWLDASAKSARSAHARYNLGTLWLERGQLRKAEPELRAAIDADPDKADAYHNLGTVHFRQRRYRLAAAEFKATTILMPKSHRAWADLGSALAAGGQDERAIAAFEEGLRLNPLSARARLGLGILYERGGDREKAVEAFHDFLDLGDGKESQRRLAQEHLRSLEARIRNREQTRGSGT